MKNSEEFRRTVFEKAKLYEAKRKARNRKIIETVSLGSLCIVIGISAYLGFGDHDFMTDANDCPTTPTAVNEANPPDIDTENENTTNAAPAATTAAPMTTTAAPMTTMTEAQMTVETTAVCTPAVSSSATSLTEAMSTETIESTSTSISPMPSREDYTFHDSLPCTKPHFQESLDNSIFIHEDRASLEYALETSLFLSLTEQEKNYLSNTFDEDFFEDEVLIVIHIPDSYLWEPRSEDGHFTYSMTEKNPDSSGEYIFVLYSISKDKFQSATLITP